MKRDTKLFRERFKRWQQGESYWDMRAEAEKRTADPLEQYDYVSYLNKYGTLNPIDTESGHYTDEFKLPGHPTFSDESIYDNAQTPGGHWKNNNVFEHSDWTMQHSDYTNLYLREADPNAVATYKGGVVLPEIHITNNHNNPIVSNKYEEIDSFIPSNNVRKHISEWEADDFKKLNKLFNGDAVGAKGVEFHKIMKNYYKGFTQLDLDGMFSTFYNISPSTFRRKIIPYVKNYNNKQDAESYNKLKSIMTNRYEWAKDEHKKGIKRRAKADVDLMYNKYRTGKDDDSLEESVKIGTVVPLVIELNVNNRQILKNKKIDSEISKQEDYGWESHNINSSRGLYDLYNSYRHINPAWGFNISKAIGSAIDVVFDSDTDMSDATKDDIALWNRHLGLKRDINSMPVTGIRFSGDYNKDGTPRLPNAEYTGLSKQAKDFIRTGIKRGKINPKKDGSWTVIDEDDTHWGKYTSHLGNYSIRENNNSGIYDVYDTYDFPWHIPISNRKDGYLIEIRDTIHGSNANPRLYDPKFSKRK